MAHNLQLRVFMLMPPLAYLSWRRHHSSRPYVCARRSIIATLVGHSKAPRALLWGAEFTPPEAAATDNSSDLLVTAGADCVVRVWRAPAAAAMMAYENRANSSSNAGSSDDADN